MAAIRKTVTTCGRINTPVVVILGSTGTGKSKLAIEVGRKLNGEIISADSMQVYTGLDVVTNKVTPEELSQCPHHLIDYISPLQTRHTVVHYQKSALPIIDGLLTQRTVPIIVGGTNYYIESLLWNFLLSTDTTTEPDQDSTSEKKPRLESEKGSSVSNDKTPDDKVLREPDESTGSGSVNEKGSLQNPTSGTSCHETPVEELLLSETGTELRDVDSDRHSSYHDLDTEVLYRRLGQVDPSSARRLHPHDRRKIIRALEVYDSRGVSMTHLLGDQHGDVTSGAISGPLRYNNLCMLWIQCQQSVLDERLDSRVDDMLKRGLIEELQDFHNHCNALRLSNHSKPDYTTGIFQSIGFKEFHQYLILPKEEKDTIKGKELFQEGVEALKRVTRRYAKKQTRWIQNRFLRRLGPNVPSVYGLDGTDVTQWQENVYNPAVEIVTAIMEGRQPKRAPLPFEADAANKSMYNVCEMCGGRVFVTQLEWSIHLRSRKHKKMAQRKKREQLGLLSHQLHLLHHQRAEEAKISTSLNMDLGEDNPQSSDIT